MLFIDKIRDRLHRRACYRQTVAALMAMPLDTALDLDIHSDDARRIARRAVYGA